MAIKLPVGIGEMHQFQPRTALLQRFADILADKMTVGDIVDDADVVAPVAVEHRHDFFQVRQHGERDVFHPQRRADFRRQRRQFIECCEQIADQALLRCCHQRIDLAGADHDAGTPRSPAMPMIPRRRWMV